MLFFILSAIEAKLFKVFTISQGLVIASSLSKESMVGTWDATVFR